MTDVSLQELTRTLGPGHSLSEERGERLGGALVEAIKAALAGGKDLSLAGFGIFSPAGPDGKPMRGLYRANLVGDICSRLGESGEQRVKEMLEALLGAIAKELLGGKRVVLGDLGSWQVLHERPQIERQPRGHRLIRPASSEVVFAPQGAVPSSSGPVRIAFAASDDLRKRLGSYHDSSIMLVVPERDFFTKTLEYYFESAGWDIEVYTKISDAMAKLDARKAYLVILDALLPDHQKFCQVLKTRHETTNVPLILLYPSEGLFQVANEVRIVGDENLPQPFEFRQLLDCADNEIIRSAEEELIFRQQLSIHLPSDEASIERVIDMIHKLLEGSGLNEEGQVAMSAAFREAVVNAAQHGHRYKREKRIEVQYLLDREKITAVVKDQGAGFNHEMYVKSGSTRDAISMARERHAQGRMGGLGIMLMLRCCDRLEYNQKGNQITLTKSLKPQG